jgi:hypothetical protein
MFQVLVQSLLERYWTPVGGCSYDGQTSPCIEAWHLLFLHKHVHLGQIWLNQANYVVKGVLSGNSQHHICQTLELGVPLVIIPAC